MKYSGVARSEFPWAPVRCLSRVSRGISGSVKGGFNSGSQQSPSPPNEDKEANPFSAENPVVLRRSRKIFRSTKAAGGIDFQLLHGECFGFPSPNGTGKTTTMRMVLLLRAPMPRPCLTNSTLTLQEYPDPSSEGLQRRRTRESCTKGLARQLYIFLKGSEFRKSQGWMSVRL